MTRVVVAGSDNSVSFVVIDFTNPIHPIVTRVNPNLGGNCRVVLDGGGRCFVGNGPRGQVRGVEVRNPHNPLQGGVIQTVLAGMGALAVQGDLVAVGEWVNAFNARVALTRRRSYSRKTRLDNPPL